MIIERDFLLSSKMGIFKSPSPTGRFYFWEPGKDLLRVSGYYIGNPFSGRLAWKDEKISVNTGKFIPGKYRINPYTIKSGEVRYSPNHFPLILEGDRNIRSTKYLGTEPWVPLNQSPIWWMRNTIPGYDSYNGMSFIYGDGWISLMYQQAMNSVTLKPRTTFEQIGLQKATAKIGSADLALGESIGELRETIQMLREPLSGLKKFFLDDSSRNWRLFSALADYDKRTVAKLLGRTTAASADCMSSTWLELRYGLRPLVGLLGEVIDRVDKQRRLTFDPDKIRSAVSKVEFGPYKTGYKYSYSNSQFSGVRCDVVVEDKYTVNASVQYKQAFDQTFLDSLGLTPRFLPETAWQLTRCSFVWDWLISIGPWLASLRVNPGFKTLGNTVGFKQERIITYGQPFLYNPVTGEQKPMENALHTDDYFRWTAYERQCNVAMSYLPHFTWGRTLDLYKAIDSVTLLWQLFASKIVKGKRYDYS